MTGTDVTYATRNNETFDGYLGAAAGAGKVPGIPLITAIFGVDREMRELADAWAGDADPAAARQSRDRVLHCFTSM
jgi:dienelactone hydrolase